MSNKQRKTKREKSPEVKAIQHARRALARANKSGRGKKYVRHQEQRIGHFVKEMIIENPVTGAIQPDEDNDFSYLDYGASDD